MWGCLHWSAPPLPYLTKLLLGPHPDLASALTLGYCNLVYIILLSAFCHTFIGGLDIRTDSFAGRGCAYKSTCYDSGTLLRGLGEWSHSGTCPDQGLVNWLTSPGGKGTTQWLAALWFHSPSKQAGWGIQGYIGLQVGCPMLDPSPCCTNASAVVLNKSKG